LPTMKQISTSQAKKLAFAAVYKLESEIKYCQSDWIKENSRHIADIECGRTDKTLYGTWPKGWKAAMKAEAKTRAEEVVLREFIRDECKYLDGIIWLANLTLIERMAA